MKKLLVAILSVFIMLVASPLTTTYWIWKANQKVIAAELCVQKDIVNNKCQGMCHLKAQIDTSENDPQSSPQTITEVNIIQLYCVDLLDITIFSHVISCRNIIPTTNHLLFNRLLSQRMLRPPRLIS